MRNTREPLIEKSESLSAQNITFREPTRNERWKSYFGYYLEHPFKVIRFPNKTFPYSNMSNRIDNRKSTPLTFLPVLLYNEFKQFLNLFYLLICLSQFVNKLKVGRKSDTA